MSARPKCPKCKRRLSIDDECDYECYEYAIACGHDQSHSDADVRRWLQQPFQCSRCDEKEFLDEIYRRFAREHGTTVSEVTRLAKIGRDWRRS